MSQENDTNKTSTDASFECDDDAGTTSKKKARSARGKTKREREEENEDRKISDLISLPYRDLKLNVLT